jgi:selenocysteine lyase/cysteine desulfurase
MSHRLEQWRADTPGCAGRIHLNNAGAALMPRPVQQAMHDHLALEGELGGYEAADARADGVAAAHAAVAALIGADARHIAFTSSATAAFVQAMSAFDLQRGDVVVTTRADYTSYQIQFLSLATRLGITVLHAENGPDGGVDPQSVRDILRRTRCRLVHVSWIPTHSGLVQDVAAVGAVCEDAGVSYLVDACQAVGQMPIDVAALKCDYLTATARKFLRGPRGIGFLYASDRALQRGDHPLFVDMRGATWVDPGTYRLAETAARFEEWEFAYALVLGLGAAAEYAAAVGIDVAHARAWQLAARLRTMLAELPGVRVLDPGARPSAIVTASLGRPAGAVMQQLRTFGINTSATLRWYGLRSFEGTDVESALRLSPHYYNTDDELDRAVGTLGGVLRA